MSSARRTKTKIARFSHKMLGLIGVVSVKKCVSACANAEIRGGLSKKNVFSVSANAEIGGGVIEKMYFNFCECRNWGWCQRKNVHQFLRMQKLGVVSAKKCISANAEIKGGAWST